MPNSTNELIKLIDAICVGWDNATYWPVFENGILIRTFCNCFVAEVARVVGCKDFIDPISLLPLMADDMIKVMAGSEDWQEFTVDITKPVDMAMALSSIQMWANKGYFTVAGATSTTLQSDHGHVNVIRPGNMVSSGKWGQVPVCANVGKENFIGRAKSGVMKNEPVGINEAFIEMPRFFAWKGIAPSA